MGSYLFLTDHSMDIISQFSSLNFIIHFAHNTMRYPSVVKEFIIHPQLLHAFLPFLTEDKDSDLYEYLSLLQSFYPQSRPIDYFYKDSIPSGLVCFRELVPYDITILIEQTIPTPIQFANEGSVHLNVYEADTTRIAAYRYYRVREKFPVPTTAIVLHLTYKDNKNHVIGGISNMEEVEKFFQKKIAVII